MLSAFLQFIASESLGVVNTGSGVIDLFANVPGGILWLAGNALGAIGS